jgi:phage terminase large subunit
MFQTSDIYLANYSSTADVNVNQGGTSSGKTYSLLQVLFTKAKEASNQVITIVGQDIPNLKAGALRDAETIYNGSEELKSLIKSYNKTDRIFHFKNGSLMEFKSYDDQQDAKSGKRDYLFVNEANGIPYVIYEELALRTKNQIYIDYNPNAEFWVHEFVIGKPETCLFISDHRHNPFLPQKIRDKIEALKGKDEELWRVYARGLTGKIEGLVLRNWSVCESIPEGATFVATGMDFGFTNDETGCLEVYLQNGELWVQELIYSTGLTNPDIFKQLKDIGYDKKKEIIADSAEPKSIKELSNLGLTIVGAEKGPDSIKNGFDILKRYHINVTRGSINLRKELNNCKYKIDKLTGKSTNEVVDAFNHLIDPLRYVALSKLGNSFKKITRPRAYHD